MSIASAPKNSNGHRQTAPSLDQWIAALELHGSKVVPKGDGYMANCPAHDDKTPSLSIKRGDTAAVVVTCFAGCEFETIRAKLGLGPHNGHAPITPAPRRPATPEPPKKPQRLPDGPHHTIYHYVSADGEAAFAVVRRATPTGKTFSQWTPVNDGLWLSKSLENNRPLYRLPEIAGSTGKVIVVEGEKCVEAIREWRPGETATTWAGGTNTWEYTDWIPLSNRPVTLLADSDGPGRKAMQGLAAHLYQLGCKVTIGLPDGESGDDIADWLATDQSNRQQDTRHRLRKLLKIFDPPAELEPRGRLGRVSGKDADGLAQALDTLGIRLRLNTRSHRGQFERDGKDWEDLDDYHAATMRRTINRRFIYETTRGISPLKFGRESWADYTLALYDDNRVDPFQEWLEQLPEWDGKPRLDGWLNECFVIAPESETLATWAGVFMLLGPIARTFKPGLKLDESAVLIGPGAIGKSTVIRYVLPPDYPDFFSDALNLSGDDKSRVEALQGRVIVECSEMAGATRADQEMLKAFCSRQNDGTIRLAFRRDPETMLRRAVIVGTSDRDTPLPNDHNLRRFVPVYLLDGSPEAITKYLDGNREQLWAEALERHRRGVSAPSTRTP